MKKCVQMISISILAIMILLGLLYISLAVYYEDNFSFGTYINGIYCTGKTTEEVNNELNRNFGEHNEFTITRNEKVYRIDLADIQFSYDFKEPLEIYRARQNSFLWIENLFHDKDEMNLHPDGIYNVNAFEEKIDALNLFQNDTENKVNIEFTQDGYQLKDGKLNRLNEKTVKKALAEALDNGILSINLDDTKYMDTPDYSAEDESIFAVYNQINAFQNRRICILFGEEKRQLTKMELAETLRVDENSIPVLTSEDKLEFDEESVRELANKIAGEYNTYGNHHFLNHDGISVYLSKGNYGNEIDEEKEEEWLLETLINGTQEEEHKPTFLHTANYLGKDDIGDTYIEISISEQKLFYFVDGKLSLETDVVTGNTTRKRGTPQRVCYVYGKQERRVLRGPGYASFVNYWMPVSGNIGIHDAPWRTEYGGDIYKTNGSHGCINTPFDKMQELYEEVEIGTPVIIYDLDNPETF